MEMNGVEILPSDGYCVMKKVTVEPKMSAQAILTPSEKLIAYEIVRIDEDKRHKYKAGDTVLFLPREETIAFGGFLIAPWYNIIAKVEVSE